MSLTFFTLFSCFTFSIKTCFAKQPIFIPSEVALPTTYRVNQDRALKRIIAARISKKGIHGGPPCFPSNQNALLADLRATCSPTVRKLSAFAYLAAPLETFQGRSLKQSKTPRFVLADFRDQTNDPPSIKTELG